MKNRYIDYFMSHQQVGGGIANIGQLYKSNRFHQQGFGFTTIIDQEGQGLGSVLQHLYHLFYPIVKSGIGALGSETKKLGKNILRDIATKPITDLIKEHGNDAISNLKNKAKEEIQNMSGKGVKRKRKNNRRVKKSKKKPIKNKTKRSNSQSISKLTAAKRFISKSKKNNTKGEVKHRILDIFD
jgi:hypothetical protein